MIFRDTDYRGRVFDRFHPRRDLTTTGWCVAGRNPEYGDSLICVCAWVRESHRGRRLGWRTRREAQAAADLLNSGARPAAPPPSTN